MTQTSARTHHHSAKLTRVLADLNLVNAVEPGQEFAHHLSLWVDFNHAITLRSLLGAAGSDTASSTAALLAAKCGRATAPGEAFARLRADVVGALDMPGVWRIAQAQVEYSAGVGDSLAMEVACEPYRRYYAAQQRDMAVKVNALRTQVRAVLAQKSPALKTLADLDAAFDTVLREREDKLLAGLPALLTQRLGQLSQSQRPVPVPSSTSTPASAPLAEHPTVWLKPGGWLKRFCDELHTVLLAELDVRLQPVLGLMQALENQTHPTNSLANLKPL